jgi:tRNA/rRNA methyltransferase
MAGTDRKQAALTGGPAIILVDPQLGENIGTSARAMLNCGLTDLRLVRPRDGWPNEKARTASSGADIVVERARLYETTAEAIADLNRVYATTARQRGMTKRVVTPRRAASEMRKAAAAGEKVGILFGRERSGLENDDIALADAVVAVPLNPRFASLNLAQAVLLVGYEWFQAGARSPASQLIVNETRPATKAELQNFFIQLERRLVASGFLRNEEKRPSMVRNIRNLFQRAGLTEQEVKTLHGIVGDLAKAKEKSRKRPAE